MLRDAQMIQQLLWEITKRTVDFVAQLNGKYRTYISDTMLDSFLSAQTLSFFVARPDWKLEKCAYESAFTVFEKALKDRCKADVGDDVNLYTISFKDL